MFLLLMFLTFTTNRWEDGSLIPFSTHSWCIFYITCWKWCYAADVTFLGYFDAPAPGLVTRHSGCWGLRPSHFPQAVWAVCIFIYFTLHFHWFSFIYLLRNSGAVVDVFLISITGTLVKSEQIIQELLLF